MMQKITPCLWFDDNVEEAVKMEIWTFNNQEIIVTIQVILLFAVIPSKAGIQSWCGGEWDNLDFRFHGNDLNGCK